MCNANHTNVSVVLLSLLTVGQFSSCERSASSRDVAVQIRLISFVGMQAAVIQESMSTARMLGFDN